MTTSLKNIQIQQGFDDLRFGMSREEVKSILGTPDEVIVPEEDDSMEIWHYDELELSVSFEEEEKWSVYTISTTSTEAILEGDSLIGLNALALVNKLKSMDMTNLQFEEENGEVQLVSADEQDINFWLENGIVAEVQWNAEVLDDWC